MKEKKHKRQKLKGKMVVKRERSYAMSKESQKHERFHAVPFIENEKYWGTRRKRV